MTATIYLKVTKGALSEFKKRKRNSFLRWYTLLVWSVLVFLAGLRTIARASLLPKRESAESCCKRKLRRFQPKGSFNWTEFREGSSLFVREISIFFWESWDSFLRPINLHVDRKECSRKIDQAFIGISSFGS